MKLYLMAFLSFGLLFQVGFGGNNRLSDPGKLQPTGISSSSLNVVAYYTVWSYCDMPPQDVDYSAITHLVLFGGASSGITPNVNAAPYFPPATPGNNSFSTTFTGTPGWCNNPISGKNHVQIMRDSCNAHGVKLLLDLGGEYGSPASAFQALIADTTKYDTYINAVDSIARHNVYGVQFDGVTIDWEYPNTNGSASVTTKGSPLYNYDLFLKKLWTKLQTWTPNPGVIGEAFPTWFWWNHSNKTGPIVDTSTIRKYVSLVNLMEYGMENTNQISHYSPLYADPAAANQETWDFRGVNEWSGAGVAKSQLNTLIPFECIRMTDNSGISPVAIGHAGGSASWIGLRDIPTGVTVHYDAVSMSNWAETGTSFYSYENATSLAAKVQYARSKNIGGVGIWELWRGWLPNAPAGQKDPLLQELKAAMGGIVLPQDTINPVVTLISPANGDSVSGIITVTANATDNVSVASVQLLINGVVTATDNTAPYTFTWNTTALSGSQTLAVKATDGSGNSTTTVPITVEVNSSTMPAPSWIYHDTLIAPWKDTSWNATNVYNSTEQIYSGTSYSLKTSQTAWGAVSVHSGAENSGVHVNPKQFSQFEFAVYNTTANLILNVYCYNDSGNVFPNVFQNNVPVNQWTIISIPISQLDPNNYPITRVNIQNYTRLTPTYYLNNIHFVDSALSTTGVVTQNALPTGFTLQQNFPNPFNPSTTISFALPHAENVSLKVFDMLGRQVAVVVNEYRPAGEYQETFKAIALSSGIYFYQLRAGNFIRTGKMQLIK